MEAAFSETQEETRTEPQTQENVRERYGKDPTPQALHCRRCKTLMENGVCPTCGYKTYVPMDERKRKKIRFIVAGVCVAVFVVMFLLIQLK